MELQWRHKSSTGRASFRRVWTPNQSAAGGARTLDTKRAVSASHRTTSTAAAGKYPRFRRAITQPDYCTTICLCNCTVLITIRRKKGWNKMVQTRLYKCNAFFFISISWFEPPQILTPIFSYTLVLHYRCAITRDMLTNWVIKQNQVSAQFNIMQDVPAKKKNNAGWVR
jgi:hypothetical protein